MGFLKISAGLGFAVFAATLAAAEPQAIYLDRLDAVKDASLTVQDAVVAVRGEIAAAKRAAAGAGVLLVSPDSVPGERKFLFDTLGHFATGRQVVCCRASEAAAKLKWLGEMADVPDACYPVSRMGEDFWSRRAAAKQRAIAGIGGGEVDVVLFGDSITHNWERDDAWGVYVEHGGFGLGVMTNRFKGYSVLDIGYGADRVQHLLWRGHNGELDGYRAKMIVLMAGTNNARSDKPADVARGIGELLELIRGKQPGAKIVLHPIFPRGEKPDDNLRKKNDEVNALIKDYADGKTIFWVDFNAKLLEPDGRLDRSVMADFLHPTPKGYEIWADALLPYVKRFCGAGAPLPAEAIAKGNVPYEASATNIVARIAGEPGEGEFVLGYSAADFKGCRSVIDALYILRTAVQLAKEKFPLATFRLEPCKEDAALPFDATAFNAELPKLEGNPPAFVPVAPWLHDGRVNFLASNRSKIKALTNGVDIVFFSDGPAGGFRKGGVGEFAVTNVLAGFSTVALTTAETINQVLWHALSGDFDGYKAKNIVVSVNPGHEVHESKAVPVVLRLLMLLREKQPDARIIVTPACPGGIDDNDEMRWRNARFSGEIAKFIDGRHIFYCDYSGPFFLPDGTLNPELLVREFVPTAEGYNIWAKALLPFLKR